MLKLEKTDSVSDYKYVITSFIVSFIFLKGYVQKCF